MHDAQQKLDEIERIQDELYRHMDRFAGMLKTAHDNPNPAIMNFLREEHREMNRLNALIDSKFNSLKEETKMKRQFVSMILLSLVLLIFVSSFAVAQDNPLATYTPQVIEGTATLVSSEPIPATAVPLPAATDAPSTEQPVGNETPAGGNNSLIELAKVAAPWLGVIGITALIIVGLLGHAALVNLGKSTPAYVREPVFSGLETGLTKLEDYAHTTETTIDDAAVAELKKFFVSIVNEIRAGDAGKAGVPAQSVREIKDNLAAAQRAELPLGAWHEPSDDDPTAL